MSQNFSKIRAQIAAHPTYTWLVPTLVWVVLLAASFLGVSIAVQLAAKALLDAGYLAQESLNIINPVLAVVSYTLMAVVVFGVDRLLSGRWVTRAVLGLQRGLRWKDVGVAIAAMPVYLIITVLLNAIVAAMYTGFDASQPQEIGLMNPRGIELVLAFVMVAGAAPFFEELLLRGYLFGKMQSKKAPIVATIIVVSTLFGVAHGQWNVAVDTFAISLVMCVARMITGSIWAGILMHFFKNAFAGFLLFVVGIETVQKVLGG